MPTTDDEIREKYLERAIRELNAFSRDLQSCTGCPRGQLMPVLGSGHPQADVFLVKHSALPAEVEEGVAFYGRTGNALMKSLKRLGIDPLAVYGTLCVKCPVLDPVMADSACIGRLIEELAIVQPKIIVVMGPDALAAINDLDVPLASPLTAEIGVVQRFTPSIEALYVPNIDEALDEDSAKREFWARSGCSVSGGKRCRPIDGLAGRPAVVTTVAGMAGGAGELEGIPASDRTISPRSDGPGKRPAPAPPAVTECD